MLQNIWWKGKGDWGCTTEECTISSRPFYGKQGERLGEWQLKSCWMRSCITGWVIFYWRPQDTWYLRGQLNELKLIGQPNYSLQIPVNMLKPLGNPLERSMRCLMHWNLVNRSTQIYRGLLRFRRLERRSTMSRLWMIIHGGLTWNCSIWKMKHLTPTLTLRCGQRPSLGLGVSKGSEWTMEGST
jgi:hypothetical protein